MSVRIMLADDHILVREGIKCLLECDRNVEVIAEADDGLECLQKLEFTKPDILLLDLSMPNMNGIEVLRELRKKIITQKFWFLPYTGKMITLSGQSAMGRTDIFLKTVILMN